MTDAPTADTVHGLGNRKNDAFNETLAEEGVDRLPGERRAARRGARAPARRRRGLELEERAPRCSPPPGLADRFEVVVDGAVAAREGIPGKPEPDMFERAAELLGLPTEACAVVEDAESGVKAGAAGEFGIVIGVDRGVGRDALEELGADVIVDELDELLPAVERAAAASAADPPPRCTTREDPS